MEIEALFEAAGFEYSEEDVLVMKEDDNEYAPEVYWKLRLKENKTTLNNLESVDWVWKLKLVIISLLHSKEILHTKNFVYYHPKWSVEYNDDALTMLGLA